MSVLRPITVPKEWSADFARALDGHLRDLLQMLNGGLRISSQIGTVKSGVRWNSDVGTVKVGPFARPVRWLVLLSARQVGAESLAVSGAAVTWTMSGADVVISAVGTLAASTDYLLDLWCLEG